MESLEELAREKFGELSGAEERVVRAAFDGTVADCRDLGGDEELQNVDGTPRPLGEQWPDTRNVRAALIRWLCIDREAREQVDPKGVRIRGARITGDLDLIFANVLFSLSLWSCRLEQLLNVQGAKIPLLSLEGSWTGAVAADGLKVEGDIFLRNGFHAEGRVRLLGATIGGNLEADGGTFKNSNGEAVNADGIKVTGAVFLTNGFSAEGEVRLLGATIGGNLEADGGTFKNLRSDKNPNPTGNALSADGINVTGDVFLRGGFHAEGRVRLHGAEITGQLDVEDAWLDALVLQSGHVTGGFFWRNIHKDLHPDFPNKEWNPSLVLTDAKVGALVDEEASWPEKGRLILDGFVYDSIADGPTDAKTRLKWLRRQPDWLGFRPQPYEQLIAVLRRMGHEHQVAEVAIAKQKDLYERGDLGWWGRIRSWFLYLVVGYGYEPWRAFLGIFLLIAVGSCVFSYAHSANVLVPSDKEAYTEYEKSKMENLPPYYPGFHAPFYSLDVVLPFDLGQKSSWRLIERWPGDRAYRGYELYSLIQLIVGWVLLLVAAAVPAGFIKKD